MNAKRSEFAENGIVCQYRGNRKMLLEAYEGSNPALFIFFYYYRQACELVKDLQTSEGNNLEGFHGFYLEIGNVRFRFWTWLVICVPNHSTAEGGVSGTGCRGFIVR